jgi:hypothetical protein
MIRYPRMCSSSRREAKRLIVGKRGGQASYKQGDINDVMARLALQGRQLVCLKSGDPMIIDRGEEALPGFPRNAGAWVVGKAGWPVCRFRCNPDRYSDLKPDTVPINHRTLSPL